MVTSDRKTKLAGYQAELRERRRAEGFKDVQLWLDPDSVAILEARGLRGTARDQWINDLIHKAHHLESMLIEDPPPYLVSEQDSADSPD